MGQGQGQGEAQGEGQGRGQGQAEEERARGAGCLCARKGEGTLKTISKVAMNAWPYDYLRVCVSLLGREFFANLRLSSKAVTRLKG